MGGHGNFLEKYIPSLTAKDRDTNVFVNWPALLSSKDWTKSKAVFTFLITRIFTNKMDFETKW